MASYEMKFMISIKSVKKKALLYCMELMSVSVSIKVSKCLHKSYQTRCSKMWSFSHSFKQFPKIDVFDHIIKYLFPKIYFNCRNHNPIIFIDCELLNATYNCIFTWNKYDGVTGDSWTDETVRAHVFIPGFGWIPFTQYLVCGIMFCYCLFSIQWVLCLFDCYRISVSQMTTDIFPIVSITIRSFPLGYDTNE